LLGCGDGLFAGLDGDGAQVGGLLWTDGSGRKNAN
jgi:hypothetical protein